MIIFHVKLATQHEHDRATIYGKPKGWIYSLSKNSMRMLAKNNSQNMVSEFLLKNTKCMSKSKN